ncbi:DUF6538 domain-containing protein [Donghicola sp.]|uniref:DUF6538 domain-containing protein n=1 Tax=Donghicola sp. TaxID=1929294 RepID=UPI00345BF199
MAGIIQRNGRWHLRMRVPQRYRLVEPRAEIHRSLRTESEREAMRRLPAAEAAILAELDAQLAMGAPTEPDDIFKAAVALAASRGVSYRSAVELSNGPLDEILERLDMLQKSDSPQVADALLGGVDVPQLKLSELVAEVERICAHDNRLKNSSQMRLWRNPRHRAVANLIEALGADKPVLEFGVADAKAHRKWWRNRIETEGLKSDTANKDFSNMASLLSHYYESLDLDDPPRPYSGISIREKNAKKTRKLEIPVEWMKEKWLAPGAFDGLNDEARDILLISIETGCRQAEIHDLPSDAIVLDAEIPHLRVTFEEGDEKREIKNGSSVRLVPLVGIALAAAKRHPQGFPRYRDKRGYSNLINKFLRNRGLMPSAKHTVGGTRHAWESRLKATGLVSDDRAEMMGHSVGSARAREVYGDEMDLNGRQRLAQLVALDVPAHLE